jgi:hypothetical protein
MADGHLRASGEADEHRWFGSADLPLNTLHRHAERIADAYSNRRKVLLRVQA